MGKRERLEDEAQRDLDRIFPGTAKADKPVHKYGQGPPLVPRGQEEKKRG